MSFAIDISRKGTGKIAVTDIWENPEAELSDSAWTHQVFDPPAFTDNAETLYIRWVMGGTDQG